MKALKIILLILIILAITLLTGTWILEILSWVFAMIGKLFGLISKGIDWLAGVMDIFKIGGIL